MLKVGIIGTGVIFDLNIQGYVGNEDVKITCVCDLRIELAKEKILKFQLDTNVNIYSDYKEMLDVEELDLLEILLPHHLHSEAVIQAARKNIKVISVQKPMALTLVEADEMIQACKKYGSILSIYENFLFAPHILHAKKLLDEGYIGNILSMRIKTTMGGYGGWIVPESAKEWRKDPNKIGGGSKIGSPVLLDNGWHAFALGYWFLGKKIDTIYAKTGCYKGIDAPAYVIWKCKKLTSDTDIDRYGILEFTLMPDMIVPSNYYPTDEFIEISGTKGIMWINQCTSSGNQMSHSGLFPSIVLYRNGIVEKYDEKKKDWKYSFINATKHLINVAKFSNKPILTGEDARNVLEFNLTAIKSAEINKEISFDNN
ncbi:MAG: Gfo/Idh/MocA family protein [Promethearchaeota archaeon]